MCAVLGDPKRLRTPGSYGYLVSWKHRLRFETDERARALVERLLSDEDNLSALRAGLGRPDASEDEVAEWLITGLAGGSLQLLKTGLTPPVFDSPEVTPLNPDRPTPVIERPTWISLEAVREDGTRLPGLPLTITAPDGAIRSEHLDSDANFRADDIPRGEGGCTIVLQASTGVAAPTTIAVKDDDVLVDPGVPFRVELATERHHRLIVVEGKTEIVLLDTAGKPVKNKRCRVMVDGRTREGLTDRDGTWVVRHLRNAEVCRVEFPGLERAAWDLLEKEGAE